jgi:hypothetical protein
MPGYHHSTWLLGQGCQGEQRGSRTGMVESASDPRYRLGAAWRRQLAQVPHGTR